MFGGKLATREKEIIHHLLVERGISDYQIIDVTNEGRELPGSIYEDEIELLSGVIATPKKAYTFWLDWLDRHYTLGDKTGFWRELPPDKWGMYNAQIRAAQLRLSQKEPSAT